MRDGELGAVLEIERDAVARPDPARAEPAREAIARVVELGEGDRAPVEDDGRLARGARRVTLEEGGDRLAGKPDAGLVEGGRPGLLLPDPFMVQGRILHAFDTREPPGSIPPTMTRRGLFALILPVGHAPRARRTPSARAGVVTATRTEQRLGEAPASVSVLTREDVSRTAAQSLDDLLRQVPGFSLFRRSSSLVGHPTTQGVSLRGIGPSGASRALVLLDGIPINDPFGGWVYWDRVPLQSVEQVEVVRGGGASVWGNYALSGVINIITRRPTERAAFFEGSYGTSDTGHADLLLTEALGPFRLSLEGTYFTTDGYPVCEPRRAPSTGLGLRSRHLRRTRRARSSA